MYMFPARLFYHKPQFALLDESTSAVSQEVEELLVRASSSGSSSGSGANGESMDTTLITITHRPHMKKYHQVRRVVLPVCDYMLLYDIL
jgi:ABC-type uncharacterized transport system fused permease/ATPase subunit